MLVDPDNGDFAPRLLDLAQAALLFHTDHDSAPARPFDRTQWSAFIGAYLGEVDLTDDERVLWPMAQRAFLLALANVRADDFSLP